MSDFFSIQIIRFFFLTLIIGFIWDVKFMLVRKGGGCTDATRMCLAAIGSFHRSPHKTELAVFTCRHQSLHFETISADL